MRQANITMVYLTLLVALLLQLFPWVGSGIILRPDFLLVVMLYWLLRTPNLCNIGTAWFVGLLVDLSSGSLLGQHALSFTITAFVALLYQRRLVLFNAMQLASYVFALLLLERVLTLILKLFADNDFPGWSYFWPLITGMLLWHAMIVLFGTITRPKSK
jgi:rod shape-determining protein MreD